MLLRQCCFSFSLSQNHLTTPSLPIILQFKADIREREMRELNDVQNRFHELSTAFEAHRAQVGLL